LESQSEFLDLPTILRCRLANYLANPVIDVLGIRTGNADHTSDESHPRRNLADTTFRLIHYWRESDYRGNTTTGEMHMRLERMNRCPVPRGSMRSSYCEELAF